MIRTSSRVVLVVLLAGCASTTPPLRLQRVVLYQSGIGYFERTGRASGRFELAVAAHEVDDVLTTMTLIDPERPERTPIPSAIVPRELAPSGTAQALTIDLGAEERTITLAYAAPAAAWRASYRLVLPDERGADEAWLQAWAVVDNTTAQDWHDISLTLATDAPLSFAVDLRTPRIVPRPDLAGYVAPPIALGPIRAEHTTRGDRDADGIEDARDRCPDEAEDRDGYLDEDGCPDLDADGDGIADVDDRCPDEPESYNGAFDDDGCPDVGRVVVESAALRILEHLFFAAGSIEPSGASASILDAIASTLRTSPELRVEVQGHADRAEDDPWRLSAERAAAVRAQLVDRGVAPAQLEARPYGDTQPLAQGSSERNRRVDFRTEEQGNGMNGSGEPRREGAVRASALERASPRAAPPSTAAGGTRFAVERTVSVPSGSSAMVIILNRAVTGEDLLLYRVDPNAPESRAHPFRAARLVNRSGIDLVPGPIALFARGELVGQGLVGALRAGENALVPYALDRSTHVGVESEASEVPARILSLARGELLVERTASRRTRYRVEAGHHVPARIVLRHPRTAGHEPHALPPLAETSPEALLVPLPLEPGVDATITIEERRPVRARLRLADELATDLAPYLAGSDLEPAALAQLRALLDDRDEVRRIRERATLLRDRLAESAARAEELRRSVRALDERAGRSAAPARSRMAERLERAVREAEGVSSELADLRAEETEAIMRLREAAQELVIEERPSRAR